MFSFLYHYQYFYQTWLYIWVIEGCLIRSRNCFPSREPRSTPSPPWVLWDPCCSCFLVFCVVFFTLFDFVLCLVYPMLPGSLYCLFLIATVLCCVFYFVWLRPVSGVPNVARVSVLSFLDCHCSVLCFLLCLTSSCVWCTQCCQGLCIVFSWLPLRFSLTFLEESNQWYIRGIEIWASFEDEWNIQHIRRIGRTLVTRMYECNTQCI